jgi:hypothetical protein
VTFRRGDPIQLTTVFSDDDGRFLSPDLATSGAMSVRVRRIGWKDLVTPPGPPAAAPMSLVLEPEADAAELAAQLPSNRWLALLLEEFESPAEREEFVRQHLPPPAGQRAARVSSAKTGSGEAPP